MLKSIEQLQLLLTRRETKRIIVEDVEAGLKKWRSEYRSAVVDVGEDSVLATTIKKAEIIPRAKMIEYLTGKKICKY